MATVTISNPVAVSHPLTQQFMTLAKGMTFADDDPIVAEFSWAFEGDIEAATAAPGERRSTRRPRKPSDAPKAPRKRGAKADDTPPADPPAGDEPPAQ